jgi:hypothetical protein
MKRKLVENPLPIVAAVPVLELIVQLRALLRAAGPLEITHPDPQIPDLCHIRDVANPDAPTLACYGSGEGAWTLWFLDAPTTGARKPRRGKTAVYEALEEALSLERLSATSTGKTMKPRYRPEYRCAPTVTTDFRYTKRARKAPRKPGRAKEG